jgi:hypothetical protein
MALLATQSIVPSGLADTLAAAAGGGDTFVPDSDTFLRANNASGGALSVTVAITGKYHGLTVTSISVSFPAGASRMIGPFPTDAFADATGVASITYPGGVTSLTIGAFKAVPY